MHRTAFFFLATCGLAACTGDNDDTSTPVDDTGPGNTDDTGPGEGDVECEDGVCFVSGVITEDQTWGPDYQWVLRGGVFVGDDKSTTTLTVLPGTTIFGESATDGMLVVRRNSKIMAQGTAEEPIVFTSSKSAGSRARGDWGGLIINGNAPVNGCDLDKKAFCEAYGEGGTGWYGGDDPADDSGVLEYVRVEFAGTLVSPDNELNGIAFQGVGSGTTIDYVHVHMNADDGVEFFGGTAQAKHIITTGIGDDNLDWTDGWQGKIQFMVAQQYSDNGDNGIEADNNGENNAIEPRSNPIISNLTLIGSPSSDSSDLGMLLREGTAGELHNIIVDGWNDACLDIDHQVTWDNANGGSLVLDNVMLNCSTSFEEDDDKKKKGETVQAFFESEGSNSIGDPGLSDPYNQTAPGFVPDAGAVAGGAAPSDNFFDAVDYIGAVDPDDDWTGWTEYPAN